LVELAPQEQLVGIAAVASGHHGHAFLLVGAPAASPFLADQLATLIVAVSHENTRLPIPYRKGETVSCLLWGSFTGSVDHYMYLVDIDHIRIFANYSFQAQKWGDESQPIGTRNSVKGHLHVV
jgi:hypothetical protein